MSKHLNNRTGKPIKVLWFGDLVALSGFGRIGNEITRRLRARGYDLQGAGISYTGWPHDFPFHIWPLGGQDLWNGLVTIVNATNPDVLVSCQDFPYHQTIWQGCRIDFSRVRWVWITPIDGTPVHPDWLNLCKFADGRMVISRFGVEALRQAGQHVDLCQPGVNTDEFYPAAPEEKAALRAQAGYAAEDWIVGVMAMNQGRKAIPAMIEAFHEMARDKPEAKLLLDMDPASPAGWDIPKLLGQMGWSEAEQKRVKYRPDLFVKDGKPNGAMLPLRNRYALLDAHMVISHREGYGLPLVESMACRIPTLALDWCSGPEIVGEDRGLLVQRLEYMEYGTWGGAKDAFPNLKDLTAKLGRLYDDRTLAAHLAETGYQWARTLSWETATDQVEDVIQRALARAQKEPSSHAASKPNPAPGLSDTYGPGHEPASAPATAVAVGDHPGLQRSEGDHPVPEKPGTDAGGGGAEKPAADGRDPGAGRLQPGREPGGDPGAAGAGAAQ